MLSILAMFPGQGSQSPGMSKELLEKSPKARLIFEEAEDISQMPLRELCSQEEHFPKLKLTSYQQPAILTHSFAVWSFMSDEIEIDPLFFAGHSLGEYTALVASGKLSFSDALTLVCERAKAMEEAVPHGLGSMLAVRTKDIDLLSKLCFQEQDGSDRVLEIVNINSPEQYILSGHTDFIKHMMRVLKENKILARQLDVSGPFHSSLMKKARIEMAPKIEGSSFCSNDSFVIANVSGKLEQPYEPSLLISQIDKPVLWRDTLQTAYAGGADTYIEFGPGKVLTSLVPKTISKFQFTLDTKDVFSSLHKLKNEFQKLYPQDAEIKTPRKSSSAGLIHGRTDVLNKKPFVGDLNKNESSEEKENRLG